MNELIKKLKEFKGVANEVSKSVEDKIADLEKQFMNLATYMIYEGHFHCSNRYDLYITSIEFYYHEENESIDNRILDPIMYHRNKKWKSKKDKYAPEYFEIGTLYPHQSGIDITFEKEYDYRASALIRSFEIHHGDKIIRQETDLSTYVYDYLFDGFTVGGSKLQWEPNLSDISGVPNKHLRKNVNRHRSIKEVESEGLMIGKDYSIIDAEYVKMLNERDNKYWRFVKVNGKFDKEY